MATSMGASRNKAHDAHGATVTVGAQDWLDAEWHFRMLLPEAHRAMPEPPETPGRALQRLVRFQLASDKAEIDVMASKLTREVDAADWLASTSLAHKRRVVDHREQARRPSNASLDVQWERAGARQRSRLCAIKSGPRMFLISCSAPEDRWDAALPALEAAIASFEPVVPPPHRHAEPLRAYGAKTPIPWTTRVPASWLIEPGTEHERAASFQAENLHRARGERSEMVGKMAFAVLERSLYKTARETVDVYLDAVREHGLAIGDNEVVSQPAKKPFKQSWHLTAPVLRDTLPGEVRCRILLHDEVWVLGGVLSMRREHDVMAWMENKRALDVVMARLRFQS